MCGQRGRGENDCSKPARQAKQPPRRRDRSSKRFIPRQNSVVHGLQSIFSTTGGIQPFAMARTQEIPLTALCFFRRSERTKVAVPPLSASRSCHSYLIAADVPFMCDRRPAAAP